MPFWLFYFFSKRNARKRLGAGWPAAQDLSSPLFVARRDRYLLINLALVALVLALAHPQLIREKQVGQPERMDVVFLLDNSPSMRAEDVPPSRLERAWKSSAALRATNRLRTALAWFPLLREA